MQSCKSRTHARIVAQRPASHGAALIECRFDRIRGARYVRRKPASIQRLPICTNVRDCGQQQQRAICD